LHLLASFAIQALRPPHPQTPSHAQLLPPGPSQSPRPRRQSPHARGAAGGYAILQAVKKGLSLPADKMMPSFVSLRDYGNTSSSSTWWGSGHNP
jgi:hypothetical protein